MSRKGKAENKGDHCDTDTASAGAGVVDGLDFDLMEAMFSRIVGAITVSLNTCIDHVMGQRLKWNRN